MMSMQDKNFDEQPAPAPTPTTETPNVPAVEKPCRGILDDGKRREICAILAVGCTRMLAAEYVGCSVSTIRKTAGRDAGFAEALHKAETNHEILHMQRINRAAGESRYWRASAWMLERRYPDRYAQREPRMFSMDQMQQVLNQFLDLVFEVVTEEVLRQRLAARMVELVAVLLEAEQEARP